MDANAKAVIMKRLERTAENLRKNNMDAFVCETKEDAYKIAESLLTDGETIGTGGSMSIKECGIDKLISSGRYNFLDRTTADDIEKCYREMYSADSYFCSSNAVIENGVLYNVDGNSNRVSAICYGPKQVIMVVGYNKIVRSLDEAVKRVKYIAAPANTERLGCDTYCRNAGVCMGIDSDCMTDGCDGARICCNYVVSAKQRIKGRIKVILVAEELGY